MRVKSGDGDAEVGIELRFKLRGVRGVHGGGGAMSWQVAGMRQRWGDGEVPGISRDRLEGVFVVT